MKLLLDTHTLLWFALGDQRCSAKARQLIEDPTNEKWVSPASHWELAIKIGLGRYSLPGLFEDFISAAIEDNGFSVLPILPRHTGFNSSTTTKSERQFAWQESTSRTVAHHVQELVNWRKSGSLWTVKQRNGYRLARKTVHGHQSEN